MIKIHIGNILDTKEVTVLESKSVKEIYKDNNIPVLGIVTLNSRRLGDAELEKPISELGVVAGDTISFAMKLDAA